MQKKFEEINLHFIREYPIGETGNIADFLIENKIIIEAKAKQFILKDDYYQIQRYLQASNIKLGLLVNFRNKYIKPKRIIRIDTESKNKYIKK